jgi:hypothetical protein
MANGKKTDQARIRTAERRQRALDLRKNGATYRQIADTLAVSLQVAYEDVQRPLAELAALEQTSAEELRTMELMRLDAAQLALAPKMKLGDPQVVNAWVRVSESRRKLLGLDAPAKTALTNPDGSPAAYAELRAVVLQLLAPYPDLRLALAEQLAQADEVTDGVVDEE